MGTRGQRLRGALGDNFGLVAAVVVALVLVGGGLTWSAYGQQHSTTEQRPGLQASYTGEFTHRATVTTQNPAYPIGWTFHNRSSYLGSIAPVLNGSFTYRYAADREGSLRADASLVLVLQSVDQGGRDGESTTYWQVSRRLAHVNRSLTPGERLAVPFSVNVTALENESRRLDDEMGNTPGTIQTALVATVRNHGRVNGRAVDRTRRYRLGIEPDGTVYRVQDPGTVRNTTAISQTVTVPRSASPISALGGPVLLLGGLVALAWLGLARQRGTLALTDAEREFLRYERQYEEYAEWISDGALPTAVADRPAVTVDSLAGLVDVAIDANRRVVRDGDEYAVVVDDLVYRFTAPRQPPTAGGRTVLSLPGTSGDGVGVSSWERVDEPDDVDPASDASDRRAE